MKGARRHDTGEGGPSITQSIWTLPSWRAAQCAATRDVGWLRLSSVVPGSTRSPSGSAPRCRSCVVDDALWQEVKARQQAILASSQCSFGAEGDRLNPARHPPEAAAEAMRAYAEEMNRRSQARRAPIEADRHAPKIVDRSLAEIVSVIEGGGYTHTLLDRIRELEAEQDRLAWDDPGLWSKASKPSSCDEGLFVIVGCGDRI
jgi:hypothetical protein